jgi:hypothetical protein
MALADNMNESPPVPGKPLVDENNPALGRHAGLIESQRQNGGLPDDPADNPVRDSNPIGKVIRER